MKKAHQQYTLEIVLNGLNMRFDLHTMIVKFAYVAPRTTRMPCRLLKLTED